MINVLRRFWLLLVIGATAGFLVVHWDSLTPHFTVIGRIDWRWLVPVGCAQALFWYVNARTWRWVLEANAAVTVSTWEAFWQLATVNAGKYLPGKVWGMVARGGLLKRHGVPTSRVVSVTVQEQYFLVLSAIVLGVLLGGTLLPILAVISVPLATAVLIAGWIGQRKCSQWAGYWLGRLGANAASGFAPTPLVSAPVFAKLISLYTLGWLLNGMVLVLLYYSAFAGAPDLVGLGTIVVANTLGITAGFFALFAPAGIGVREGFTAWLMGFHFPLADAVVLTVLFRLWLLAVDVVFVAAVGLWESRRLRNSN